MYSPVERGQPGGAELDLIAQDGERRAGCRHRLDAPRTHARSGRGLQPPCRPPRCPVALKANHHGASRSWPCGMVSRRRRTRTAAAAAERGAASTDEAALIEGGGGSAGSAPHKALGVRGTSTSRSLLVEDQARNGRVVEHLGPRGGHGWSEGSPGGRRERRVVTWYLEMHVDEHAHEVVGAVLLTVTRVEIASPTVIAVYPRAWGGDELAARESEKVAHRAYGSMRRRTQLREARPARMQLRIHLLRYLSLPSDPKSWMKSPPPTFSFTSRYGEGEVGVMLKRPGSIIHSREPPLVKELWSNISDEGACGQAGRSTCSPRRCPARPAPTATCPSSRRWRAERAHAGTPP